MASSGQPATGSPEWALTLALVRFGSDTRAARVVNALRGTPPETWMTRLMDGLGIPVGERSTIADRARRRARMALAAGQRAGLRLVHVLDDAYPPLLHEIADPPLALWCAGKTDRLSSPAVAIVGSRRAAPTGLRIAQALGHGLAEAGLVVISGLARGVDAAAHAGALDAGGATIAVLGSGTDVCYPPEHTALARRLQKDGAIVSEFPPGTRPLAHHFPLRNRIISGLSRAVVVIEASGRSGSLITARLALEQGREVLAVPGTVASGQHSGCHALIKDGAGLVETVEDVLNAISWPARPHPRRVATVNSHEVSKLEAAMEPGESYTVDELAARTGLNGAAVLAELGALEVAGLVGRIPGAGFVKFDKSAIGGRNG